ncbi:uncharacterized protein LOC144735469 [Lampetra planeri]
MGRPTLADFNAAPPAEQLSAPPTVPSPASGAEMEEALLRLAELLCATASLLGGMQRSQAMAGGREEAQRSPEPAAAATTGMVDATGIPTAGVGDTSGNDITSTGGAMTAGSNVTSRPSVAQPNNAASSALIHNNDAEDRIWDFRCKETFDVSRPVSSFATSYVNNFDEKLDFTCPFNSIVSGIGSYHSNDAEDRRWKFTCTMQANVCMGACQWTDYLNDFDAPMFWVTPDSRYLVGAHSYHSNDAEDRRWKFQFCTKAAC